MDSKERTLAEIKEDRQEERRSREITCRMNDVGGGNAETRMVSSMRRASEACSVSVEFNL